MTAEIMQAIEDELFSHFCYLNQMEVDLGAAKRPYDNEQRRSLMAVSQSTSEAIANALLDGNIDFLLEQLPGEEIADSYAPAAIKAQAYTEIIRALLQTLADKENKGRYKVSRDDLFIIFDYCVGNMPSSPTKFTQYMNHKGITLVKARFGNTVRPGIELEFKVKPDKAAEMLNDYFPGLKPLSKNKVVPIKTAKGKS